jgi:hypothetical protein
MKQLKGNGNKIYTSYYIFIFLNFKLVLGYKCSLTSNHMYIKLLVEDCELETVEDVTDF